MTKCDFYVYSSPHEGCYWSLQTHREKNCEKAIGRMAEALKNIVTVKVEEK